MTEGRGAPGAGDRGGVGPDGGRPPGAGGRPSDARRPPPAGPARAGDRPGFTLLELLVVTVLLGVLAAIALPIYQGFKERAATSSLQTELRTLRNAQELYFVENDGYADDPDLLDYSPGDDVEVELRAASDGDVGWAGRLGHRDFDVRCAVFQGSVSPYDPATDEGSIACDGDD